MLSLADTAISGFDRLISIALISFFPLMILDFIVMDRLVRLEYTHHRRAWEKSGSPHGYFWVPPESKMFGGLWVSYRSSRALRKITRAWLFKTPEWIRQQDGAHLLLWLHRCLFLSCLGCFLLPFLLAMVS